MFFLPENDKKTKVVKLFKTRLKQEVKTCLKQLRKKNIVFFRSCKMPRTKDEIWKQFNEVTLANGTIRAECKECKASIVGLVSRLKTHFEACSKKRAAPQNTTDDEPTPKQTK